VPLDFRVAGLGDDALDYLAAWELQREVHAAVVAGAEDTVLLLEALISVCADFGVTSARVPGRSGVWLSADARGPERKIAAIGLRVSRGVAMHGFALNCDVDLGWYDRFVPCGIADAGVTSLSTELGRDVTVDDVLPSVEKHLTELLAWGPYAPTPDYEARPEPPRIALVTPSA